ncbi:MAG: hypothetical protein NZ805_13130 [Armatimonadetes bacterium]|nr:hypothetical protein [Armatimonadota bacterium]MDW8028615.1 hypothetical protein [Armatimonadota bacterium]
MPPGVVLVVFWLIVAGLGITALIVFGVRQLNRWLNTPDEPSFPLPDKLGAECVVLKFAHEFIETVPKKDVPEWRRHKYIEIVDDKLVLKEHLAEIMIFAALAELWQQGLLNFRVAPKEPDPFDPHSLDKEVFVSMGQMLPLTPLGRSFAIGFKAATRPVWLLREKRNEAVLEDMIEFALREVRRCLGWRKAKRNSAENLVRYVQDCFASQTISSETVETVKKAIDAFRSQSAELAEAVKATIGYTLMALRRLEPDRDELGL